MNTLAILIGVLLSGETVRILISRPMPTARSFRADRLTVLLSDTAFLIVSGPLLSGAIQGPVEFHPHYLLFGLSVMFLYSSLDKRTRRIVIAADGVSIRSLLWRERRVAWKNVEAVVVKAESDQESVRLLTTTCSVVAWLDRYEPVHIILELLLDHGVPVVGRMQPRRRRCLAFAIVAILNQSAIWAFAFLVTDTGPLSGTR